MATLMDTKNAYIGFRCAPEIKAALERAAEKDGRTLANLLNRELAQLVADRGWLIEAAPPKRTRKTASTG